jgi:hypothetical protein
MGLEHREIEVCNPVVLHYEDTQWGIQDSILDIFLCAHDGTIFRYVPFKTIVQLLLTTMNTVYIGFHCARKVFHSMFHTVHYLIPINSPPLS